VRRFPGEIVFVLYRTLSAGGVPGGEEPWESLPILTAVIVIAPV
jgi:hypothetical protein